MKRFFSLLLMLAATTLAVQPATADDDATAPVRRYDRVNIQLHDGTHYTVRIDGESSISSSYSESDDAYYLYVDGSDYHYRFGREEVAIIKLLECEEEENGIIEIADENNPYVCQIYFRFGSLTFSSSLDGTNAYIYDLSGALAYQFVISRPYTYNLDELQKGAYTVKAGNQTLKFMKR